MPDFLHFFTFVNIINRIYIDCLYWRMYKTLDELEDVLSRKPKVRSRFYKFFNELKILWLIFTVLFLWTYLVTNAQLVIDNFNDRFSPNEVYGVVEESAASSFYTQHQSAQIKDAEIDFLIDKYKDVVYLQQDIAADMNQFLQYNLNSYEFTFNLLPPTNRIIIPAINLDVPLVQTDISNYHSFDESTFDGDLENWVVKYPTTPNPWEWWNAFFFGHTSQEYWKNNPYWTVFRRIPQLKQNDKVQVIWDGVLYEYKVVETIVVKPKDVNDSYVNFWEKWKEYITLMWCYPIWRTDKRMMVFAEKI